MSQGHNSDAPAILAAAIIATLRRNVSMSDVQRIYQDCLFMLVPQAGSGTYREWKDSFNPDEPYT